MHAAYIKRGGIQYVMWDLTNYPVNPPITSAAVSIDNQVTWHTAEVVNDNLVRILCAHPETDTPGNALVLLPTKTEFELKLNDNPEIIVLDAGTVWLE